MKRPLTVFLLVLACSLQLSGFGPAPAWAQEPPQPLLKAAIFVQNRAGSSFQDRLDEFNDLITLHLTDKGFSVIDKNVVLAKFRESHTEDDRIRDNIKSLETVLAQGNTEARVEDVVTGASALRIAQMIGADYLIMAAINSFSTEVRTFHGQGTVYGTDNQSNILNLRVALKVLEGNQGGSLHADTVTASERIVVGQGLTIETNDMIPRLLETCAQKLADKLDGKIERIRNTQVATTPVVEFRLTSNIEGAAVELDGAVIGSTPGQFQATPGLHQLRVSREWMTPWERTVNILPNQLLNVTLELSPEGNHRYATLERLKIDLAQSKQNVDLESREREAAIDIAREQSGAKAYAEKIIAEGEKTKRQQSYDRKEGATTTTIYK